MPIGRLDRPSSFGTQLVVCARWEKLLGGLGTPRRELLRRASLKFDRTQRVSGSELDSVALVLKGSAKRGPGGAL
jgi:hypothetical protein